MSNEEIIMESISKILDDLSKIKKVMRIDQYQDQDQDQAIEQLDGGVSVWHSLPLLGSWWLS